MAVFGVHVFRRRGPFVLDAWPRLARVENCPPRRNAPVEASMPVVRDVDFFVFLRNRIFGAEGERRDGKDEAGAYSPQIPLLGDPLARNLSK